MATDDTPMGPREREATAALRRERPWLADLGTEAKAEFGALLDGWGLAARVADRTAKAADAAREAFTAAEARLLDRHVREVAFPAAVDAELAFGVPVSLDDVSRNAAWDGRLSFFAGGDPAGRAAVLRDVDGVYATVRLLWVASGRWSPGASWRWDDVPVRRRDGLVKGQRRGGPPLIKPEALARYIEAWAEVRRPSPSATGVER